MGQQIKPKSYVASTYQAPAGRPDLDEHSKEAKMVASRADTYFHVPGPPHDTYGPRAPASCVRPALRAQGTQLARGKRLPGAATAAAARTPYVHQPQACRTHRAYRGTPSGLSCGWG